MDNLIHPKTCTHLRIKNRSRWAWHAWGTDNTIHSGRSWISWPPSVTWMTDVTCFTLWHHQVYNYYKYILIVTSKVCKLNVSIILWFLRILWTKLYKLFHVYKIIIHRNRTFIVQFLGLLTNLKHQITSRSWNFVRTFLSIPPCPPLPPPLPPTVSNIIIGKLTSTPCRPIAPGCPG